MNSRAAMGRSLALFVVLAAHSLTPAAGAAKGGRQVAPMRVAPESIKWPVEGEYQKLVLRVSGQGVDIVREFQTPYTPKLELEGRDGERLPDGAYNYELRVVPAISLANRKKLAAAREEMDRGGEVDLSRIETMWRGPTEQAGTFAVVDGLFLTGNSEEPKPKTRQTGAVKIDGDLGVSGAKNFVTPDPASDDQQLVYAALEGPEAGTYYRGSAKTTDGEATIDLPATSRALPRSLA